jgi:hypothetical protein
LGERLSRPRSLRGSNSARGFGNDGGQNLAREGCEEREPPPHTAVRHSKA